jgi:hypothetical protein
MLGVMHPSRAALWRYNYKILIGSGYWIIVLPVAASQVVTLWMFALSHDFSQLVGTQIAELMTPIVGAFLVAHALAPEYRSGIGAVLACKPVSLGKLLVIRVGLALLVAVVLTWVTLMVCSVGLSPIDLKEALLPGLPSLWFLSMAALALATLFRSALAGFASVAALWALNVAIGFTVHPLLSLQGLSAKMDAHPLAELWVQGKLALFVSGLLLLIWSSRLVSRLGRSSDRTDLTRIAASVGTLLLIYVVSGAVTSIGYGYLHRGHLVSRDVTWMRRQVKAYAPVPVERMFGPAFTAYVSDPAITREGESLRARRIRSLERALQLWPKSLWSDSIAYDLATERGQEDAKKAVDDYFAVAARYASSPFAPKALAVVASSKEPGVTDADRLRAARQLVAEYPNSEEVDKAATAMDHLYPDQIKADEYLKSALVAADSGPRMRRPYWLATAARLHKDLGQLKEARARATEAISVGKELMANAFKNSGYSSLGRYHAEVGKSVAVAEELIRQLDAPRGKR